ncbi:ABC transporter ATP-binding protein [Ligilactobacillus acidipiscis]|uniref:ABC transporter ATP-binding protein n=1 Tax=Ligilactobacillus acidipiscis TaxID=89059 RepID=UPI0023F701D3|nr:ABC transporter ATP-binding protein [Ligilactobacillus acidipiscis]WEV57419.1 ABC transporter ATP-binding protein [Ligilactobacillus acidipiscis]
MGETIQVKDLAQGYGKNIVISDINLSVKSGEILGLIGPSGAGKTTLINSIMGMLKPKQGSVTVLGESMPNRKILARIGFMAQADALYETLTARENLIFFGQMQGMNQKDLPAQIEYATKVVNLDEGLDKHVSDYSGGMKRRLSLAIALVADPEILILDEPTVGIDPELRQQIWQELHRLGKEGKTILLTTHVMDDAEESDSLLMIRNGVAIAQGQPDRLIKEFKVKSVEEVFLKAGRQQDAYTGND